MTLSEVDGRLCDARLQIPTSEIDDEELTFCGVLVLVWDTRARKWPAGRRGR